MVHNGIIENHADLREELQKKGRKFLSETDTEIVAHLIAEGREAGHSALEALKLALKRIDGAFALAILDETKPDQILFAKMASPLVVGLGDGESFLASDIPAVLTYTRRFHFLEDGDIGVLTRNGVTITDASGQIQERAEKTIEWSPVMAEKGGHKHFMHKEIFEQPRAITDTLRGRLDFGAKATVLDGVDLDILQSTERVHIVACGTSYHSGMVGKYLIEKLARIPVQVDLASEFRYRDPVLEPNTLVVAISQSGETADTLAAMKEARKLEAHGLAISNVIDSAIPRLCNESAGTLYTRAGPEIGVASTKAFVTQLCALHLLALTLAHTRKTLSEADFVAEMTALSKLPREVERLLGEENKIKELARKYVGYEHMLFLGRGTLFPIALEGALKLKEISYIHAEGYAAGEMKHGPIALIDENMPVVVLAAKGHGYEKVVSNLEEVRARGGRIIGVCHEADERLIALSEGVMSLPDYDERMLPILSTVPLQIFSYHMADLRGTDVDQPRNLAKSVTVE